jgi:hypothetical protein
MYDDDLELEQGVLLDAISKGHLVPVLGGDINLCGRPVEDGAPIPWTKEADGVRYPPSTCELALYLLQMAQKKAQDRQDLDPEMKAFLTDYLPQRLRNSEDSMSDVGLANVCQYIQFASQGILDTTLPSLLSKTYRSTALHDFLVKLARYEPPEEFPDNRPYPCIVSACFDQVLEQQLRKNGVPFHLVARVLGPNGGTFRYTRPNESVSREINPDTINEESEGFKKHAVVIKLNGGIPAAERNFAVTEDHYIDYLSHQGLDSLPGKLLAKLTKRGREDNSHLLFIGYSPRHWNLRVILHRIWKENLENQNKRWTVLLEQKPGHIDAEFWKQYAVKPDDIKRTASLEAYMTKLADRLKDLPGKESGGSRPETPAPRQDRNGVFISYSHEDADAFEQLIKMLAPVRRKLNVWHDRMIEPGARWREEIKNALATAKAAILLVSPDFLNSDFILRDELPPLLHAAETDGCRILWIKLKDCLVSATPIGDYQALRADAVMDLPEEKRNRAFFEIAEKILKSLSDEPQT